MAELRRILVEPSRLMAARGNDPLLSLLREVSHYLSRVLRLRKGDAVSVVDGVGHLWRANLVNQDSIRLVSSIDNPEQEQDRPTPFIGLAVDHLIITWSAKRKRDLGI